MPANLPAEARRKWAEVSAAKGLEEKLRLMQEFLSLVPKHKGTAKLCAQVKKQMAVLRREIEYKKLRKAGRGYSRFFVEREGAAQIVLIGFTNVGRSSLLTAVTNAKVEVSPFPYTTKRPALGMLHYGGVQFQIVEAPALMEGSAEGRAWGLQTLALARNADGLMLMVDLSQNPVDQLSKILAELEGARILIGKPRAHVEIKKEPAGTGLRITLLGKLIDCALKDVEGLLKSYRITDALVKIYGEATLDDVEDAIFGGITYKPAIIVANKADLEGVWENFKLLKDYVGDKFTLLPVSCKTGQHLEGLGEALFKMLDIIRVYTKGPSDRGFSEKPFVLKRGSTVSDLARNIHSDLYEKLSYARIWSSRFTFSPQKVSPTFTLEDGDIVEIHTK